MSVRCNAAVWACLSFALAGCGQQMVESEPLGSTLAISLGPDLLDANVRSITYEDAGLVDALPSVLAARPGGVVVVEFARGPSVTLEAMSLRSLRELRVEADDAYKLDLADGRQSPLLSVEVALRDPQNPPHLDLVASELAFAARSWLDNALARRRQLATDAASWN